jgi:hypothetical protein
MEEALSFFRAFEIWVYALLGLGGLFYLRKFILSWQELQGAGFGLERENAQSRLNQSASVLVVLLTMAVAEFVLVSFIAPAVPGATPLFTPTVDLLATPTITLAPLTSPDAAGGTAPPVAALLPTETSLPICDPGQIQITSPQNSAEVQGKVQVLGTADIPNFGFFKLEVKRPDESVWLPILAGDQPVVNGELGNWDTSRLPPSEYELGLVVLDNQARPLPACIVRVRVIPPAEETARP